MRIIKMTVGPLSTNCYIVSDENTGKAVIIDPGAQADRIQSKITELDLSVEAILLTHGHFDHMMAAEELRKAYGADIYIGKKEKQLLGNTDTNLSEMFGKPYAIVADQYVEEGMELALAGVTFRVIDTPGHTEGGVCYYVKEYEAAFSGDTIFYESVGRTDFPTGSMRVLVESIHEKIFTLPEDTQLFPGHGNSTTVGYEKQNNLYA